MKVGINLKKLLFKDKHEWDVRVFEVGGGGCYLIIWDLLELAPGIHKSLHPYGISTAVDVEARNFRTYSGPLEADEHRICPDTV